MFSKTKIVGILMVITAVAKLAMDILDGGGVRVAEHAQEVQTALAGAGLFFMRDALAKLESK